MTAPADGHPADGKIPVHRVAIVVFCEVYGGVDYSDAAAIAESSVRTALSRVAGSRPMVLAEVPAKEPIAVIVHAFREVGVAAGNGYLRVSPTSRAYPRENDDG